MIERIDFAGYYFADVSFASLLCNGKYNNKFTVIQVLEFGSSRHQENTTWLGKANVPEFPQLQKMQMVQSARRLLMMPKRDCSDQDVMWDQRTERTPKR